MRWAVLTLACASCATASHEKMPWPLPAAAAGPAHAMGGPLEAGGSSISSPVSSPGAPSTASAAMAAPSSDPAAATGDPALTDVAPAGPAGQDRIELQWPVATTGINSLFGDRVDPIDGHRRFHGGVDLEAPYGAIVVAAAAGVVVHSGWAHGHGRQVIIEHAGGFRTVYSHLSQILVSTGTRVRAGDAVGQVGNSGRSTGAHLHFEVSRWGHALDPVDVLGNPITIR